MFESLRFEAMSPRNPDFFAKKSLILALADGYSHRHLRHSRACELREGPRGHGLSLRCSTFKPARRCRFNGRGGRVLCTTASPAYLRTTLKSEMWRIAHLLDS